MNFEYPDLWKERDNKKNLNINETKNWSIYRSNASILCNNHNLVKHWNSPVTYIFQQFHIGQMFVTKSLEIRG